MAEIVVAGDSFHTRTAPSEGWPIAVDILGERLGMTVENMSVPGAGYVSTGLGGPGNRNRFSRQLLTAKSATPKAVLVLGSVNDRYSASVEVCMTAWMTLKASMDRWPTAKHLWVGPQWSGPDAVPADVFGAREAVLQAVWGLPFQRWMDPIDQIWFPRNRPDLWAADKFHPSAAGQVMMADRMEPALRSLLGL